MTKISADDFFNTETATSTSKNTPKSLTKMSADDFFSVSTKEFEALEAQRMKQGSKEILDNTLQSVTKPTATKTKTPTTATTTPSTSKRVDLKVTQAADLATNNTNPFAGKTLAPINTPLTNNIQQTMQGKLPAASLLQQTGGGPANASQIPGISEYQNRKKDIADTNAPDAVKAYANAMNYLAFGNPLGRAVSNSFAGNSGVTRRDSTGNKTVDKITDIVNDLVTPFITPTGAPLGQGIFGSSYETAGQALNSRAGQALIKGSSRVIPGSEKVVRSAVTEGLAGGVQGVGFGLQQGQDSGNEIARNALWGAGGGAVLAGAGTALGEVLGRAFNRVPTSVETSVKNTPYEGLTREQRIYKQYLDDVPLAQEDLDFMVSPEWNESNLVNRVETPVTETPLPKTTEPTPVTRAAETPFAEIPAEPVNVAAEVPIPARAVKPKTELKSVKSEVAATTKLAPVKKEVVTTPKDVTVVKEKKAYTPKTEGVRSNYKTIEESGNISDELKKRVQETPDKKYNVFTDAEGNRVANENIKDLSTAETKFMGNEYKGKESISTGYRIAQELDKLANATKDEALKKSLFSRSLAVLNKVAEDLTTAGQTAQAGSLIKRMSPDGQLLDFVRKAEANGLVVSEADKIKFKQEAKIRNQNDGAGIWENELNDVYDRMSKKTATKEDLQKVEDLLNGERERLGIKTPETPVKDNLPKELNDAKKRDSVVSFLDSQIEAAQARINKRKGRLNSLPVEEWIDYSIIISSKVAKGVIKAETYAEDLVKLFGQEIKPIARQVFEKAQELVGSVTRSAAEGDLLKAEQAFYKASGQAAKDKAIVEEMAMHVRQLMEDSKTGNMTQEGVQKLRDYADEVAEMLEKKRPAKIQTNDDKFLQKVKQLSKKIAQVESESIPSDQANREVSSLLRQITKLSEDGLEKVKLEPIDTNAINNIAYDVLEKTRQSPKPTTLEEKILAKFTKANPDITPDDIASLTQLTESLKTLKDTNKIKADIEMQKIMNKYVKSSANDKLNALRYMAMLLNDSTQAINALSGPIMSTLGSTVDVFGLMVDVSMNKVLKTPRSTTLYGTNPIRFVTDWMKYARIGGKAGYVGANPSGIQGVNEIRGLAFKNPKNPLSIAERTLGAVAKGADFGTYKAVYQSELQKQGFLDALEKGIKRSDKAGIKAHVKKFMNDPPVEAIEQADRIGKETTFQRNDSLGGKTANWINSAPKGVKPVVNAVVPFVRTPINMASSAVNMTPAGIIKGLFQLSSASKASQREAIRTLSLGIVGSAGLSGMGYYLSSIGIITGSNDTGNKDVNNINEQAGRGKYRFNSSAMWRYTKAIITGKGADEAEKVAKYRKGDKQFDYNKLQPVAFPLAIGAGFQEKKGTVGQKLGAAGSDAFGSLFGMSSLKGIQDTFQPQYTGTEGDKTINIGLRVVESYLKSFSPSFLAQEARRIDPVQRKVAYNEGLKKDILTYYQSRIPLLSKGLAENKDTLGNTKRYPSGFLGQHVNPYKSDVANYTPAAEFIADLIERTGDKTVAPKAPAKDITGYNENDERVTITIEPKRYAKLQEEMGAEITRRIMEIESDNDDEIIEEIKDIYSEVREEQRDILREEFNLYSK